MPRHRPIPLVFAGLAWTLGWLLLAVRWRVAPVAWTWAGGDPVVAWGWLLIPLGGALAWANAPRSWPWPLAVWPALPLAVAWLILPSQGRPGAGHAAAMVGLLGLAAALWRVGGARPPRAHHRGWRKGRLWLAVHALALILLLLLVVTDPGPVLTSCLLYPLYALLQLWLLLALPWPWFQAAADGRRPAVVALAAGVFALVHWPNPAVMLLTGGGMVFWAREYGRGRPLPAVAMSMGLLATLVAQGLPAGWTWHMQVGPAAVRQQAVPSVTAAYRAQAAPPDAGRLQAGKFLAALYPPTVGRPLPAAEADRWLAMVEFERRCQLAWAMLKTDEARRRRHRDVPDGTDPTVHWTEAAAPWPERIRAHALDLPRSTPWNEVLAHSYRQLLGRPASPAELALWDADLGELQYQALVRALLAHHGQLARAPFDTLASEELRFWR